MCTPGLARTARARPIERGRGIGHLLVGIDKRYGHDLRIVLRLCQQQIRQRLQPRLFGDLGLAFGNVFAHDALTSWISIAEGN